MTPKKMKPIPKNPIRAKIRQITKSKHFINFTLIITLLNSFLFMLYWHRQPEALNKTLGKF